MYKLPIALFVLLFLSTNAASARTIFEEDASFQKSWSIENASSNTPSIRIASGDDGDLFALNINDKKVYQYSSSGVLMATYDGDEDGGEAFVNPVNISGEYLVIEEGAGSRIQEFSEDGELDESWPVGGVDVVEGDGELDADDDFLFILTDTTLRKFNEETSSLALEVPGFAGNRAIAGDEDGNLYVLTDNGATLKKFTKGLEYVWSWSLPYTATDIAVDEQGNIFIAYYKGYVKQYTPNRDLKAEIDNADIVQPSSLALGDDGYLYILNGDSTTVHQYKFRHVDNPKEEEDAVYRFWSKVFKGHFFTSSFAEAQALNKNNYDWEYEVVAYKKLKVSDPGATEVHRFWSEKFNHHFYTANKAEKDHIIANDPNWAYEGVDYYVYETEQPGTVPAYRFWSDAYKGHFYTTSESEKDHIIANDPNWSYEGQAWWVKE